MPDYTVPLLLMIAAILGVILYLSRLERALQRIEHRKTPQFPDLAPLFQDLQERIEIGTNTVTKDLHAQANIMAARLDLEGEAIVETVQASVAEDGKKTRQRTAQIKTRMADEERSDQRTKSQQRRVAAMKQDKKPTASK